MIMSSSRGAQRRSNLDPPCPGARDCFAAPARTVQPGMRASIGGEFVLSSGLEIARVMALVKLTRRISGRAVDHAPALHRRTFVDHVGPALHVLVFVYGEKFGRAVLPEFHE